MATTRSRPHGREHARPAAGGVAAEHATKIYAAAITGIVIIVAFLALTSIGHVIDAATQHFMLFYAGVFALIALCASTGLGLVATDRVFLNAGHRVLAQSAHRAASFGAVTFLIIHIVTEILAQRVHVLDAVVPFLSPFRTFYIGLGTIASDLIILLVITGIMRGRFNAHGRAWRWRAIHYTSYASFVFGVWHGLLAGRPAKPYVDWSYGLLVALVLLALAVRIVSNSLRPKENLSGPPVPMSGDSASAPMRAAAMFAQLGAARANTGGQPRLMVSSVQEPVLSAPVSGGYPGAPMLTAPLPAGTGQLAYEPGYEGPPRYLGAPRAGRQRPDAARRDRPDAACRAPARCPRAGTGPMPRAATGSQPRLPTGPFPRPGTGPMPRAATGPMAAWATRRRGRVRSSVRADAARRDRPVPAAPRPGRWPLRAVRRRGRRPVIRPGRCPAPRPARSRARRPVRPAVRSHGLRSARYRADAAGCRSQPPADSGPLAGLPARARADDGGRAEARPQRGFAAKNAERLVPAGGDRPDAAGRVRPAGRRSRPRPRRRPGFRPDAARRVRSDAPAACRTGPDPAFRHRPDARRGRAAAPAAFRSALRPDAPPRHRSAGLADVRSRLWSVPARRDRSAAGGRHRPPAGSVARIGAEAGRQVSARPGRALAAANAGRSRDRSDARGPGPARRGQRGGEPPAAPRRRWPGPEPAGRSRVAGRRRHPAADTTESRARTTGRRPATRRRPTARRRGRPACPSRIPTLRYREPGPGMPGYRGSRDARYGGDRR